MENDKYKSMIIKICEWIAKWQLKVIIVSWVVFNDKWVENCIEDDVVSHQVKKANLEKI